MGETTLRQALGEFQAVYMPLRNYAPRTRIEYINDLEDLMQFLEKAGIKRVGEVSLPDLERYQAELDNRGLTGSTRKRKTISIRTFFNFLHRSGYVHNNVSNRLIPPYSENTIPRVLTQTEYQRLISICSQNIRDHAVIELVLQTGIRLSELVRLNIYDIDLPEGDELGIVRIICGGGRKSRNLPLNSKASQALANYLQIRPASPTSIFFVNRFGTPLGPRGVQKIVQKYMTKAGIRGASVQSLRHTFGVHHAVRGTSLRTIQEVMGFKDIRSTEIYVILAKQMMRKELEEHAL